MPSSAGLAGDGLLRPAMEMHLNPVTAKIVKIGEGEGGGGDCASAGGA
jgi:hypothetical protein